MAKKVSKKINISDIFDGLQGQMRSKLSLTRKVISHPTAKGDVSELEWIEMLSSYLPQRYSVNKAFVIDHEGNYSEQLDIVIFDRHYSPFIFKQDGASYIPAECVYAVIEVKQTLDKGHIEYTAKKAKSVRKLLRTSAKIVQADGREFEPKKPPRILAGILSLSGKITKPLEKKIASLPEDQLVNFGCSLDGGFFLIEDLHPWKTLPSPVKIKSINDENKSLIMFFLALISELQKMGTIPAIEIDKYLSKVK